MLRRFSLRRSSIKTYNVFVLDGTMLSFNLDSRTKGKELLEKVLQECALTSSDKIHFSLATDETSYLQWVLMNKPLKKQLPGHSPYTLTLRVHIYPFCHHSLMQSLSRHYLYLQIKQDLQQNRLQPSSASALTRIASLMVQAEVGNYIPQSCANGYIQELQILPMMTSQTEEAIKQAHSLNRGRLPGECEEEVLDLVQEEATYGSVYYNIQNCQRQPMTLCVCPVGLRVAQRGRQISCFKWENILKVSHRGRQLHLNIGETPTLAACQVHYQCLNSQMASNIVAWCQILIRAYCTIQEEELGAKSRLKRFFSTRRSLRRPSGQMRRQTYAAPSSQPVSRRNRRASLEGNFFSSSKGGSGSPKQRSLPQRTDSNLVIYGLSGLASTQDITAAPEQATSSMNAIASSTTLADQDEGPTPTSPMSPLESVGSEVFEEEGGLHGIDTTLHVIEEEKNGFTSGSLTRASESERSNSANPTSQQTGTKDSSMGSRGMARKEGWSSGRREDGRDAPQRWQGESRRESYNRSGHPDTHQEDGRDAPQRWQGESRRESYKRSSHPDTHQEDGRDAPQRWQGESRRESYNRSSHPDTHQEDGREAPQRWQGEKRRESYNRLSHPDTHQEDGRDAPQRWQGESRRENYDRSSHPDTHHQHPKVPSRGSVMDVEHKSASSLLEQRRMSSGQQNRRNPSPRHTTTTTNGDSSPPPPPVPPRTSSSSEMDVPPQDRDSRGPYPEYVVYDYKSYENQQKSRSGGRHSGGVVSPAHRSRMSNDSGNHSSSPPLSLSSQQQYHHSNHSRQHSNDSSSSRYRDSSSHRRHHPQHRNPSPHHRHSQASSAYSSHRSSSHLPATSPSHASSPRHPSPLHQSSPLHRSSPHLPSHPRHPSPHYPPPSSSTSPPPHSTPSPQYPPPPSSASPHPPPSSASPHPPPSSASPHPPPSSASPHPPPSPPPHRSHREGSSDEIRRYPSPHHHLRPHYRDGYHSNPRYQPQYYSQRIYHSKSSDHRDNHRRDRRMDNHWRESARRPGEDNNIPYDSHELMNGGSPVDYNSLQSRKQHNHHTSADKQRERSSFRNYQRRYSQGDSVAAENWGDDRERENPSPSSSSTSHKYARYESNSQSNGHHQQAWKTVTWQQNDDDNVSRTSSSLPLHTNPDYSLYEEDEEGREGGQGTRAPRQGNEGSGRHVLRHKRLRHSTITSLTSFSSDLAGGMSRLGSIASLDHQASFAELSQADSVVSGFIDPHVRSLVFEASQHSQGTEL